MVELEDGFVIKQCVGILLFCHFSTSSLENTEFILSFEEKTPRIVKKWQIQHSQDILMYIQGYLLPNLAHEPLTLSSRDIQL